MNRDLNNIDTGVAEALVRDLDISGRVSAVEFLDKGYSADRKFRLHSDTKPSYLLRVSDISEERIRRSNFDLLSRLSRKGIACPRAIHFGTNAALGVCFIVQTYLPGECAEEALPKLPAARQYDVGRQAGEELRRIHEALLPPGPVDDLAIRSGKYAQYQKVVGELAISFEGQERAAGYVDGHLHLLRNRPTTFRHGDYHPGNLLLQDGMLAGVVDFNRCDWGDPVDDFYKLALFGAPVSEQYARGQVIGYFGREPPKDFWPLYNLYVAMVLPGDIVWTEKHYPQFLSDSLKRVELVASTHDLHDGGPPAWWRSGS